MKYANGFEFADSILGAEGHKTVLSDETFERIQSEDPKYLELLIATYTLNSISRIDWSAEGGTVYPDYDLIYQKACDLVETIDMTDYYLQTDIEASHSFCGSPWDIWIKTPAQYLTVIEGFSLETGERTIDYLQYPDSIDEVLELLEANRVEYGMTADEVSSIAGAVACLDPDDIDDQVAPEWVYRKLIDYINGLVD
jgi:hypothetical protein